MAFSVNLNKAGPDAAGTSPIAFTGLTPVWNGFFGTTVACGNPEYAAYTATGSVQATCADTTFAHHNMVMAVFTGPPPPTITGQPVAKAVNLGATATLSVTATAAVGPLSYQWQIDTGSGFGNISGATSASYTTGALAYSDNASRYQCVVTDTGNSQTATSNAVKAVADFNTSGSAALRYFSAFGSGPFGAGASGAWITGKVASGGNVYNLSMSEGCHGLRHH